MVTEGYLTWGGGQAMQSTDHVEMSTWNPPNLINQCHPNNLIKKESAKTKTNSV